MSNLDQHISMTLIWLSTLSWIGFSASGFAAELKERPPGRYAKTIASLVAQWESGSLQFKPSPDGTATFVRPIPTSGDDDYVGVALQAETPGTPAEIAKVFTDTTGFLKLAPGVEKIENLGEQDGETHIRWTFESPPFSHVVYETKQIVKSMDGTRMSMKYRLAASDEVEEADGLVFVEAKGDRVRYFSIDFFKIKLGFFGRMFRNEVWRTSCENVAISTSRILKQDLALKDFEECGKRDLRTKASDLDATLQTITGR